MSAPMILSNAKRCDARGRNGSVRALRAARTSRAALVAAAMLLAAVAQAQLAEMPRGEATERHLPAELDLTPWVHDPAALAPNRGDRVEVLEVPAERLETVKLTGVVPPIRFASGVAQIPDSTLTELRAVLGRLRGERNVRLHLVGHADSQPLSPALISVFGDNEGLSRERAGEVAEFLKRSLDLPPEAVAYEWRGDTEPVASNATEAGRALNRRVEVEVWYDEPAPGTTFAELVVRDDFQRIKVCRMETLCRLRYVEGEERRTRVQNVVKPLHYETDGIDVSPAFIEQIRQAFANMGDRSNVLVKFIGYTDDLPLGERDARIYGDHLGLSRARARRVALAVQEALRLPTAALASDGRGATRPLGSNETPQGRALNRRVEVEFWYDDPLRELPDEPQLCPIPETELVTRVYDPPWGTLPRIEIDAGGAPRLPAGLAAQLRRALGDVAERMNPRLRFIGYTANETLERRTALVYEDDIGLSAARARRALEAVNAELELDAAQLEFEGRGYVQSDDVVNAGFIQGQTSYVVVQVVYDEEAELDDLDGVNVTPLTRELAPQNAFGLNLMRITVDGVPIDDPARSSADIQRCTDVALAGADIRFNFDNLVAERKLSVGAEPGAIAVHVDAEGAFAAPVRFTMYANYAHFIDSAEVRVFAKEQSLEAEPLAIVPLGAGGAGEWLPDARAFAAPARELKYVLRAYGKTGGFDETVAQPLWIVYAEGERGPEARPLPAPPVRGPRPVEVAELTAGPGSVPLLDATPELLVLAALDEAQAADANADDADDAVADDTALAREAGALETDAASADDTTADDAAIADGAPDDTGELLAADAPAETVRLDLGAPLGTPDASLLRAYGENELGLKNIALASGSVTVSGSGIPDGHSVWVAGRPVPLDPQGNFIAQEILPSGVHTVEVAVLDEHGNGELFLRDLELKQRDWFYVGMADLTLSSNDTSGPIELMQGDDTRTYLDSSADARLAFYVNGKFGDGWRLTASADTRDEPLDDLFSNFLDKSPESLFRRLDPDNHFPTFGDDGTVEELAPTLGKLFVRAGRGDNYAQWGSFKAGYMQNELAQVDRGLYGANVHYESRAATRFGERRYAVDGFAAEPGTISSYEELRGTGGSLYFLRRQDILAGSERVRVELRDPDSGLVTGVRNLMPGIDYDIDYLQGRVLLSEPLASTAGDGLLVRSGSLTGDEAWLVVRYEYTPGFTELDAVSVGAQAHYWFGERVKLGVTGNTNDEGALDSGLAASDVTVRMSAGSWVKLQGARTEGLITSAQRSADGGFGFSGYDDAAFTGADADGRRADVSLSLGDFFARREGRVTLYGQSLDAGYSAPGLATPTATDNYGGSFAMPITDKVAVRLEADNRIREQGLRTNARELDVSYRINANWDVSTGVRRDERLDSSAIVPLTQQQGERTDAIVQVGYDSKSRFSAYGFVQETTSLDGDRDENGRVGMGGEYRLSERLKIDAEVSNGDLGTGGKVGTSYMHSERTSLYMRYALENEPGDFVTERVTGAQGSLVAGVKSRLSDSTSVYLEERYQRSNSTAGLTQSTGVNLVPSQRMSFSASSDIGRLQDALTGAETDRRAIGFRVGYSLASLQLSSGLEYRNDETEQPDLTLTERTTWLVKNSFKYQITSDSRLVGKLNHAESESSLGQFFDGGYTEAVLGYAFRPVRHDRLNTLVKYTYFYNVPTTEQLTLRGTAAEYLQKSYVAAVDLTYDLTPRWSIGGKVANRRGRLSLDRENPSFFDNDARLYIVRADFRFKKDWEGIVESRVLDMPDVGDRRSGALVAVSRSINRHLKAGAGYNFTDFSDDLTDLDFDHRGFFLNLTGML